MSDKQRQGTRSGYDRTSQTNQAHFLSKQLILKLVQSGYLARIDACTSAEENSGSGLVNVTPLTCQTDTEGQALPMVSIENLPHCRYQHGIAAVIIDPVPGDIVSMLVNKNDISTIKPGTTEPVNAGSFRQFSQSDSVMLNSVHTKTPEVYIVLRQDKTIKARGPEGIRVETDKTLDECALENRTVQIGKDKTETIGGNCSQDTAGNKSVTVQGACSATVQGAITVTGASSYSLDASGAITINGGALMTVTAAGAVTVSAPNITFDTPSASFTGNVSIAGGLSQGGGRSRAGGDVNAVFHNNLRTLGSISAEQTVTGSSDVIGGGISLKGHKHTNVQPGPATTGGPV